MYIHVCIISDVIISQAIYEATSFCQFLQADLPYDGTDAPACKQTRQRGHGWLTGDQETSMGGSNLGYLPMAPTPPHYAIHEPIPVRDRCFSAEKTHRPTGVPGNAILSGLSHLRCRVEQGAVSQCIPFTALQTLSNSTAHPLRFYRTSGGSFPSVCS